MKREQGNWGLTPRDYAAFAVLLVTAALGVPAFALWFFLAAPAWAAAADRDVLLCSRLFFHAEHVPILSLVPLLFVLWLSFFGIFGVSAFWLHMGPIFGRRKKQRPRVPSQDRRRLKRLLAIGAPLLLLSLLSIYPRSLLHTDYSLETRGVFNNVLHSYAPEEITALELKTISAPGGDKLDPNVIYGVRAACTMTDGREYAFLIGASDGDDVLRAMLALRECLPAEAVTVWTTIPLETLFREERWEEGAQTLLRELFSP